MARRNWTREETILAFELYCKIPFGKIDKSNPDIIKLAQLIDRTSSSVAMKMCNLARHDPELKKRGIVGLRNGSKLENIVWEEFQDDWETLAYESQKLISKMNTKNKFIAREKGDVEDYLNFPVGEHREQDVKQRVGQQFFRSAVLTSYEERCCITGISVKKLLIASHIKPWKYSDIRTERTNPTNGLCLNALHDKAFDQGLITIDSNYKIVLSSKLKGNNIDETTRAWLLKYEGNNIIMPQRFLPGKLFIEFHNDVIFQKG